MRSKALLSVLITIAVVSCLFYLLRQQPKVQEVREASMMKFLHVYLHEYGVQHDEYPASIYDGIENGLLDDFPKDRILYLQQAMDEGRLDYALSDDGNFRIRLMTNLNREIIIESK